MKGSGPFSRHDNHGSTASIVAPDEQFGIAKDFSTITIVSNSKCGKSMSTKILNFVQQC
jgi:hypothetical protein